MLAAGRILDLTGARAWARAHAHAEQIDAEPEAVGGKLVRATMTDDDGNTFTLEEVFQQRFEELGLPCIRGLMIGHVRDRASVPLGVMAELDADAGTLTLLETAVS